VDLGDEQPRFLGRTLGYVVDPGRGLPGEPEALTRREQQEQTARAHRAWQEQAAREWGKARSQILDATEGFRRARVGDRQVVGSLRAIQRSVARIDERIGLDL
jgi:hypothetical protein